MSISAISGPSPAWELWAAQPDTKQKTINRTRGDASTPVSSPARESATTTDTVTVATVLPRAPSLSSEMLAKLDMQVMVADDPAIEPYANQSAARTASGKSPQTLSPERLATLDMRVMVADDPAVESYANQSVPSASGKSPQTSIIA
jgi:hypothetical protein